MLCAQAYGRRCNVGDLLAQPPNLPVPAQVYPVREQDDIAGAGWISRDGRTRVAAVPDGARRQQVSQHLG